MNIFDLQMKEKCSTANCGNISILQYLMINLSDDLMLMFSEECISTVNQELSLEGQAPRFEQARAKCSQRTRAVDAHSYSTDFAGSL